MLNSLKHNNWLMHDSETKISINSSEKSQRCDHQIKIALKS